MKKIILSLFLIFICSTALLSFSFDNTEKDLKLPDRFYGKDVSLPIALGNIRYLDSLDLTIQQKNFLSHNGFVVIPSDRNEFSHLYESTQYQDRPVFLTVDAVLHVYHLLFNKILRELEDNKLYPELVELITILTKNAKDQYIELKGTTLEFPALRAWTYFEIAQQLILEYPPSIDKEIINVVNTELDLINKHEGIESSPLMTSVDLYDTDMIFDFETPGYYEDYSQYIPRSHYTKTEQRKRYFKTMSWLGRINFRITYQDETEIAILINSLLMNSEINGIPAIESWKNISEPIDFLVGTADDLGPEQYIENMFEIFGKNLDYNRISNNEFLSTFIDKMKNYPPPQINSFFNDITDDIEKTTKGYRFFGQRFVLDSYIFTQLIWRNVGSFGNPRWLPKGLDVFAALGNNESIEILKEIGEFEYLNYEEQLEKLQKTLSELDSSFWYSTVYSNWLYCLNAVIAPKDETYPSYMRTVAWARKELNTALSSWTELKHDTNLYSKQVMAECGDDIREYDFLSVVEPNPIAFYRLLKLAEITREGLDERNLLTYEIEDIFNSLTEELQFYIDISIKELKGETITNQENERILFCGGWLEWMMTSSADMTDEGFYKDNIAAIVADVATNPNGFVLEEATGKIFTIFVITPDFNGNLQITTGGVYSYYEFQWPSNDRLTDEKWRDILNNNNQVDRPIWTNDFIVE